MVWFPCLKINSIFTLSPRIIWNIFQSDSYEAVVLFKVRNSSFQNTGHEDCSNNVSHLEIDKKEYEKKKNLFRSLFKAELKISR